jgi:anti-sigma regulatory factor (Ser/Thr protein kinase)
LKWAKIYVAQIGPEASFTDGPRTALMRALSDGGVSKETRQDAELCFAEVFNNFVEHGLSGCAEIEVSIWVKHSINATRFLLMDTGAGVPFDLYKTAFMPRVDAEHHADLPEGGFGLALVKMLANRFLYRRLGDVNVTFLEFCTPQKEQTSIKL